MMHVFTLQEVKALYLDDPLLPIQHDEEARLLTDFRRLYKALTNVTPTIVRVDMDGIKEIESNEN